MIKSRERRLSSWSNATGAMPLCEALSSRRGRRAHHAQKDRVGTWEIPRLAVSWSAGGPHREGEEPKPMMHGRGKSDPAIGAVKPANKAEQSAAELVEQRAGTEGNADQQSTRRAQDRESVSQALGRIRQAAKQRKKEKFTALFHHISVELLRLSFFELKKDAAPGVDGLAWQDYEADLDHNIEDLHARV